MKYYIFFNFLVFAFLLTSCNGQNHNKSYYVGKIQKKVSKELRKEYGLESCCFGSKMLEEIEMISISFILYRSISKGEARNILVNSVEKVIEYVNSNEEIQPYLANIPFGPQNVVIIITIYDENGKRLYHPSLSNASSSIGRIFYRTNDPESNFGYKDVTTETFDQAKKLIIEGK